MYTKTYPEQASAGKEKLERRQIGHKGDGKTENRNHVKKYEGRAKKMKQGNRGGQGGSEWRKG